MSRKYDFPEFCQLHDLDYAAARDRCSRVAIQIKDDLGDPKREKGVVKVRLLECATSIVDNLGFPQEIMCRFMIHAIPDVSPRTIRDALPDRMKDFKKVANARRQKPSDLTGDFDIPFTSRQDDDFAASQIIVTRDQIPKLMNAIENFRRSQSKTLGLWVSENNELFKASIPSQTASEEQIELSETVEAQ